MMGSTIEIQQRNRQGKWENIGVSKITTSDDEVVVLGRIFRILVNGTIIYEEGGA